MDILFIHQNMPAQFRHLAPALAVQDRYRVVFVTQRAGVDLPGVRTVRYDAPRPGGAATHHYVRQFEAGVRYGQQVARTLIELKNEGFDPAVIIGHPGWGEMLFVRDVFPRAAIISYAEFYYSGVGADVGFDPDAPASFDAICRTRVRNSHLLLSLEMADFGLAPTEWQRSRHPAAFLPKIRTIFDGIDVGIVRPVADARFVLPDGRTLTAADEVVTYTARNLEPYRGYPSFIRAVPAILRARPHAHVVICGGDEVSYGRAPDPGADGAVTWRAAMNAEVPLDTAEYAGRVHFTQRLPYARYLSLLQISSAHVYLTVPFVLSWSCLEAMSAGCIVVASDTPPVREVIEPGVNGLLVPFFDPTAIAAEVARALAERAALAPMRAAARATIVDHYALDRCLPRQIALVEQAAGLRR